MSQGAAFLIKSAAGESRLLRLIRSTMQKAENGQDHSSQMDDVLKKLRQTYLKAVVGSKTDTQALDRASNLTQRLSGTANIPYRLSDIQKQDQSGALSSRYDIRRGARSVPQGSTVKDLLEHPHPSPLPYMQPDLAGNMVDRTLNRQTPMSSMLHDLADTKKNDPYFKLNPVHTYANMLKDIPYQPKGHVGHGWESLVLDVGDDKVLRVSPKAPREARPFDVPVLDKGMAYGQTDGRHHSVSWEVLPRATPNQDFGETLKFRDKLHQQGYQFNDPQSQQLGKVNGKMQLLDTWSANHKGSEGIRDAISREIRGKGVTKEPLLPSTGAYKAKPWIGAGLVGLGGMGAYYAYKKYKDRQQEVTPA